jgi:hypothetical protein
MIARASMLAIVADHDPPDEALAAFVAVMDQWEEIGNEALQWWTLLSAVVLLERLGAAGDAAVLGGAVLAATERRPAFAPDTARLEGALGRIRARLGEEDAATASAAGATLHVAGAVTRTRGGRRCPGTRRAR